MRNPFLFPGRILPILVLAYSGSAVYGTPYLAPIGERRPNVIVEVAKTGDEPYEFAVGLVEKGEVVSISLDMIRRRGEKTILCGRLTDLCVEEKCTSFASAARFADEL